jgi:ABC-type antimicrobial peptide transport system permease subunit
MKQLPVSPVLLGLLVVIAILPICLLLVGRVPIRYNLRNLVVRWPMTLLTALAFTLVIGLLTVMLAFVSGMSRLTDDSGHAENVVVLADGATDESYSVLNFTDSSDIDHEPGVAIADNGKPLCSKEVYLLATMTVRPREGKTKAESMSGIVKKILVGEDRLVVTPPEGDDLLIQLSEGGKVYANDVLVQLENLKPGDTVWLAYEIRNKARIASEIRGSDRRRFVQIRGVEDPEIAAQVHGLELLPGGKWFSDRGVEQLATSESAKEPDTAVQVVLGEGVAKVIGPDLNKPTLEVGDVFELGLRKWKVVGILKTVGTVFGSEMWAKRAYVGELFGKPYTISSVTIRTASPEAASELAEHLKTDFKKAKLNALTETEYYSQQRTFLVILLTAIIILTVFMAMGGIFGVMNTMFAAISHRTKDIGMLRILGYARWQVLVSFLLESVAIAVVGGLAGCALGSLLHGLSATSVVGSPQTFGKSVVFRLTVTGDTIAIGIILTLLMGLCGGLLPALAAMRQRPLEALR